MNREDLYIETAKRIFQLVHWLDDRIEPSDGEDSLSLLYGLLTIAATIVKEPQEVQQRLKDWIFYWLIELRPPTYPFN